MIQSRHIYFLLLSLMGMLLPSCTDDGLGFRDEDFRDGETTVSLDLSFSPFSEGALTRANIEDGNGKLLNTLRDLCILVYDMDGNLIDENEYPQNIVFAQADIKEETRTDADASNSKTAESSTKCLNDISLRVPFGKYYIIGVANLGKGDITSAEYLKTNHAEEIKTLDGLRRIKVNWDKETLANNSEMLGYFTDSEKKDVPSANKMFQTVSINRPNIKLHSWLRRTASKITIDFDGSNLRDNVKVYIKEARIYDISYDCTLGFGTTNGSDESQKSYNHRVTIDKESENGFIHDYDNRQVISYVTKEYDGKAGNTEYGYWPHISKGAPLLKDNITDETYESANVINFHSETADALYFYENMQSNTEGKTKVPVADLENGGVSNQGNDKDGIPYGTYIEVEGYYRSDADGTVSYGPIKYRFMLGKNTTDNFEAERNYHYKLTLKPRGNGNDADWHIEYVEEKGFHVPNPWYVSYLYNHDAILPFNYTVEDGWEVVGLKAEIIKNPWYPSDIEPEELKNPNVAIIPQHPFGDEEAPYNPTNINLNNPDENGNNKADGHGFLSLRATTKLVVTNEDAHGTDKWPGYDNASAAVNYDYYKGLNGRGEGIDRSTRIYMENGVSKEDYPASYTEEDKEREKFTYQHTGNSYDFNIPLFTRAKVLVKESGYSGNNPFVGYQRVARVKLTVTKKNKTTGETDTDEENVNVVQVRRVVNPKGVYRRYNNYEPFHVKMMWLDGDDQDHFSPVVSHGSWMAEIIGDENFITLDGKKTVSGGDDTNVEFTIRFNRASANTPKTVRNAVVRVRYHNYTCTHLIFVRQGYAGQPLVPSADCIDFSHREGGATPVKWSVCNLIARNYQATDPRDEGSLFLSGIGDCAIDAFNNIYHDSDGNPILRNMTNEEFHEFNNDLEGKKYYLANKTTGELNEKDPTLYMTWSEIQAKYSSGAEFTNKDKLGKAATVHHFEQLYLSRHMQFGYGVLYADGATETQEMLNDAYGYYRRETANGDGPKGMRGMFAYYWDGKIPGNKEYNARNLFFPIGRSGYGHRKHTRDIKALDGLGILRYACLRGEPEINLFSTSAPLFVSIYRRPGAIYYSRKTEAIGKYLRWDGKESTDAEGVAYGLDINYFSFDVNSIGGANVANGRDACFVRTVEE